MNQIIVESADPITLAGGGAASVGDLIAALDIAPTCVAADGGAALVLAAGRVPEAVIGDMDSLAPVAAQKIPPERLHRIAEQDSTDFAKCLMRVRTPLVIGVGFLGKRLDHQLAVLNTLCRFAHQPCVLIGAEELVFHVPAHVQLPTAPGETVSLFPMGPVRGRSTGLHWPIDGIAFAPGGRVGTSNRATGPITLDIEGSGMLAMVPRRLIQPVCQALLAARPAPSPAPEG